MSMVERELDTVDMTLNMGPQHPATHGVFRMVLTVDGERIMNVEPHIGYLHRGVEKLCENQTYRQNIPLMDRLDYLGNFNNELVYVMAIEKLMGVQVPERAEYIRVILCELNRIASHMMLYGAMGSDSGVFGTAMMYAFKARERLQQIFEAVSGARLMHNYFRVGGVKTDVPPDFRERLQSMLPDIRKDIDLCDHLLTDNDIFLTRSRGIGVLSAKDAINMGVSGPNLRASGVQEDIRRSEPYSVYERLDFVIPTGPNGDCFDRYWVRMEEMRQSVRIVAQALAQLPDGPVMADMPRLLRPPAGEVYVRAENPRGELGVYLVSEGGDRPYRMKVRGPSFCTLTALRQMLIGCYVADCVLIVGSIDIVLGEVDR